MGADMSLSQRSRDVAPRNWKNARIDSWRADPILVVITPNPVNSETSDEYELAVEKIG
jgi:hypothetical protein